MIENNGLKNKIQAMEKQNGSMFDKLRQAEILKR